MRVLFRSGNQQHVGMPRRGDETQPEPRDVVVSVVEGVNLKFAAVAGAGIDLADRKTAPQVPTRGAAERFGQLDERRLVQRWCPLGERWSDETFEQQLAHRHWLSEVVAGVRAIERLVAEREVGDDVAVDRRFAQWPLEPGRVAEMAARSPSSGVEAQPDQDIATNAFDKRHSLAGAELDIGPQIGRAHV